MSQVAEIKKRNGFFCVLKFLVIFIVSTSFFFFMILSLGLPLIENFLIARDKPQKSDAIIVLTGHPMEERIQYAVKLYQEGIASKIILCGQMILQKETGIDLMKIYALQLGVNEEDLIREAESSTTWENATFSKKLISEKGYKKIIVVTSPTHTRRAGMIFKQVFPSSVELRVTSPQYVRKLHLMKDPVRLRFVGHEILSFVWYFYTRLTDKSLL